MCSALYIQLIECKREGMCRHRDEMLDLFEQKKKLKKTNSRQVDKSV